MALVESIALDLDQVLGDTRPLWRDWLDDAARRARVDLDDLPEDRAAAAVALDERLGDWRPLLERFAADRGPLHFRPRPDVGNAVRRLHASGTRIGVVTDAPRELAEIALAHLGVARRIDAVGTLDEVRAQLGAGIRVVESRAALSDLQ